MPLGIWVLAVGGKIGGSMVSARLTGMSWTDSLRLGARMNTRGLVELIVLNIGYDLGVLPGRLFSMLVVMALTTAFKSGGLAGAAWGAGGGGVCAAQLICVPLHS